ncbi:hypothetical protein [Paludibaculum fermentans]|uniref:Uncharacterized protein n=1 Tax=Paludibaculum fermentans TaxID=1473598 RepID=A0A7S7SMY6_PALFE|nr:hypothetical protein [Paludibaculum fermentans]QOY90909.1 hypothetical protein IRI77_13470 [Paludibaculum fermentans]
MTPQTPSDPLIALWQTTPAADTSHLLSELERLKHLHLRLRRTLVAILCAFDILLIFEEATGRLSSYGILSALWTLGLALGVIYRRRQQNSLASLVTRDMVSLLRQMIVRAKRDLFLARCLYVGAPLGAIIAYLAAKAAGLGASSQASVVSPRLHALQTGAGVAAILAMMLAGLLLERARRAQVQHLGSKLQAIMGEM